MENYDITLKWSKLSQLSEEEAKKVNEVEGVYRISKKETDGKFYVIFVGSATDLGVELSKLIVGKESNFLKQGGDFAFRYAPVSGDEKRKTIEKQMYKQYAPEYNKEPISSIDIKVNLN